MASRARKVAENETAFRGINERVVELPERQAAAAIEKLMFYCECGDENCYEHVHLTGAEYQAVRADPMRFAIVLGHEVPDVERVVATHDGYAVIEKDEELRGIVEETDPRKRASP